jgi:hypothetical protein
VTQPFTNAVISDSMTTSSPGTYGVVTTLTLANWTGWKKFGLIRIKDLTGQSGLSITPPPKRANEGLSVGPSSDLNKKDKF